MHRTRISHFIASCGVQCAFDSVLNDVHEVSVSSRFDRICSNSARPGALVVPEQIFTYCPVGEALDQIDLLCMVAS